MTLRCRPDRSRPERGDGARIADRERARTQATVADGVVAKFPAELAEASAAAGDAAKAVDALLCAVLNAKAEGIAVHYHASKRPRAGSVRQVHHPARWNEVERKG
jgi:hypothetical protein